MCADPYEGQQRGLPASIIVPFQLRDMINQNGAADLDCEEYGITMREGLAVRPIHHEHHHVCHPMFHPATVVRRFSQYT